MLVLLRRPSPLVLRGPSVPRLTLCVYSVNKSAVSVVQDIYIYKYIMICYLFLGLVWNQCDPHSSMRFESMAG